MLETTPSKKSLVVQGRVSMNLSAENYIQEKSFTACMTSMLSCHQRYETDLLIYSKLAASIIVSQEARCSFNSRDRSLTFKDDMLDLCKIWPSSNLFLAVLSLLNNHVLFAVYSWSFTINNHFSFFCWAASVDLKNNYDEWCVLIQKAQDKARGLLKEYDEKFASLKVSASLLLYSKCISYWWTHVVCYL